MGPAEQVVVREPAIGEGRRIAASDEDASRAAQKPGLRAVVGRDRVGESHDTVARREAFLVTVDLY
jgi:hypothetical protein